MTDIYFTKSFLQLDSTLVWNIWYDETTQTAYVDLQDYVYAYHDVPLSDVEALVNARSIGRAFNGNFFSSVKGFKQTYGPGDSLGHRDDINKYDRKGIITFGNSQTTLTHDGRIFSTGTTTTNSSGLVGKNLTYSPDAVVDGEPVRVPLKPAADPVTILDADDTPVRVSLRTDEVDEVEDSSFVVHFETAEGRARTHKVSANSWQDAVAKVSELSDALGANIKLTGVFINLA